MEEDYVLQRRAEGNVRVAGGKGVKGTKATIKHNTWDKHFTRGDYVVYGEKQVVYSLNKHGRWEEIARLRQEVESQPPPPPPDDDNPEKKEDEEENASATTPVVVAPVVLQDPPSVAQTKRVEPNPNHKPDDTPTTAVIDIKTHLSGDPLIRHKATKHQGTNIPRIGFSGGSFSVSSGGGRNYAAKMKSVYCGDCFNKIGSVESADGEENADGEESKEKDKEEEEEEVEENDNEEEGDDDDDDGEDEEEDEEEGDGEENACYEKVSRQSIRKLPVDEHPKSDPGQVWVQHSFKAGEYPLYRETRKQYATPCMGCFRSQGPMWMLRGMGNKARKKTKGFKKITRRDLSLHTD